MQVSNEALVLGNGIAKYVNTFENKAEVSRAVITKNPKKTDENRYLLLSNFKKIFVKNYNFKGKIDEKQNLKYFDNYVKFNTPFYEYLHKDPKLINKIILSTSFCYYSTPSSIQGDIKQILDYFITDYKNMEILDYSSHIGFDTIFFAGIFKKVYVNDIEDVFLKILKINFTTLGITNYEICRDHNKMQNISVIYFDPPFAGWDEKAGDYFYGDKKLQDVIAEFKDAKVIIIKHHKDLPYVDYTFNFIKHYNKKLPVDKTKIFSKISIMRAKPLVNKMQMDFLVSIPSYGTMIREMLQKAGFMTE
jgi:hypothetical protein